MQSEESKNTAVKGGFADTFSSIVSWVMTPLFMPVIGIIFIFSLSVLEFAAPKVKWMVGIVVFALNVVLPMIIVFILKLFGIVKDVGLNERGERLIPYIVTAVCFGGTAWFLYSRNAPMWVVMFYAGGMVAAVINLLVNFRWKISAHAAGTAGVVALLLYLAKAGMSQHDPTLWLIIWIVLSGVLGSCRIWLGRHTPMQVFCGYAVGFLSVFFMMMIH